MSAKTIRLFQENYPHRKPSAALRLRNEAAKIRAKAQSLISQSTVLDLIADELERNDEPCKQ
jgi:hypothetical protein